ncbi:MAG TPA: prolyl oligopeptidase family serine peptidase [Acidimicrobiales bacterium]|nr:prolyl oligopeptidase family serine peptidase [Acidimicrobiales bacterium]
MTDTADSFPRQNARTRRFTLGAPRDIKVAGGGSRIAFLRSTSGSDPVNRLWIYDVASQQEREVVDPSQLLAPAVSDETPAAERARRERARELAGGIVAFDADRALTRATFAFAGRVFVADLESGDTHELSSEGSVFDPRLDPTATRVAYVSGATLRVTGDDGDRLVIGEDRPLVSWGSAEFVAAEEMHRTRGFWWAPSGDRLLVERVDVSPVAVWHIASPVEPWVAPATVRYPAAGTANAAVGLAIVGLDGSRVDIDWSGGEFEYLCDVAWPAHGEPIAVVQTRDQRTLAFLGIDAVTGVVRELRRLRNADWTDLVPGVPAWSGTALVTVEVDDDTYRLCVDGEPITPHGVQVRRVISVDGHEALVAASTDPTETHVARVDLASHELQWLSTTPGVHGGSSGGGVVVLVSQSMDHDGSEVAVLVDHRPSGVLRTFADRPVVEPRYEFAVVGERGLRTALVLPSSFDGDQRLPVLLDPYGGPGHARVVRSRAAYLTSQWFADQGFAIVIIDGRGTPGRSPSWERAVRNDLAGPVIDDQADALAELAELHHYLDLSKVGVRGWSFGGYLAALAVLRRPDMFHAAVAGAPVTDWRLYDTHYTERFLGDPQSNSGAYDRSDVVRLASQLERPLLLIHGLADDNVVVAHTLALSQALLEAGRPHRVLPLSGVTHMTSQEVVAENLLNFEVAFFREALRIDAPQPAYRWRAMLPRRDSPL